MRACILGCAGKTLTAAERAFFRDAEPFGFILFRRNIECPDQVRALTSALRNCVGRDALILVDQEGGRVQRLGPPHWPKYPAAGTLAAHGPELVRLGARLMAHDLLDLGINVDCLPVLDIPAQGADGVIGDRAYGQDVEAVATLGRAACEGLMAGGVLPVIKHMPGHGRATADSHKALPVIKSPLGELGIRDFEPFRRLNDMPLAMSAHVVLAAVDPMAPATQSARVIEQVVRGAIGFDGLLMTDDLSMKALKGPYRRRAEKALAAGCDVVLHCNGAIPQMRAVVEGCGVLAGRPLARAEAARPPKPVDDFDVAEGRARFAVTFC